MAAQQQQTAAMESEDQVGTTFTAYSSGCKHRLTIEYVSSSNRLRLAIQSGDSEWSSEWLECHSQLPTTATVQLIQEGLKLWPLLASRRSGVQESSLRPLELAAMTYNCFEACLA